jgi:hypothetical protein
MSKVKQNLVDKERLRIQNSVQDKTSFIGRNVALNYLLLYFLYPIAAIYSAFTGGSALLVYIRSITNHFTAALTLTVLVAIVIEVAKYFFGNAVSDDVRQHVWTESSNHVTAFVLKAVAFVGVFAFSITLSLTGAPDVATEYREASTPVGIHLVNLDSINAYYDAQIAAEREDISAGEKMTWKGAIIADGRTVIKTAKTNIQDYETKRSSAINGAQATNNETIKEYDSDTAKAGNWLTGFAGLGEALAIIILLFVGNYQSGAEKEVLSVAAVPTTNGQSSAAVTTIPTNQPFSQNSVQNPNRRPIGFEIPDSGRYNGGSYNDEQTTANPNDKAKYPIGQCAQCGNDYEKTVWNKKYCSDECKFEYHAERNNGQRFNVKRYQSKK